MRRTLTYVLCYLLWIVSVALGVFDMLILRGLLVNISALAGANRWVLNAIDKFGLFLLGLAWLVFALVSEGNLLRRLAWSQRQSYLGRFWPILCPFSLLDACGVLLSGSR